MPTIGKSERARVQRESTSRTPRADSADTRERLLASSLRLFSERGYEGTSLRAITDAAGVNLASANYHFGSKQQLLEATFFNALEPINAERLRRLDELESRKRPVDLADLVRAFAEPVFFSANHKHLPKLLANLFAEPKEVAVPLLRSTFGPTVKRFLIAIGTVLPEVDRTDLEWRLHLVIGSMMQLAHFNQPLITHESVNSSVQADEEGNQGIQQLINFAVAGLSQGGIVKQPKKPPVRKARSKP